MCSPKEEESINQNMDVIGKQVDAKLPDNEVVDATIDCSREADDDTETEILGHEYKADDEQTAQIETHVEAEQDEETMENEVDEMGAGEVDAKLQDNDGDDTAITISDENDDEIQTKAEHDDTETDIMGKEDADDESVKLDTFEESEQNEETGECDVDEMEAEEVDAKTSDNNGDDTRNENNPEIADDLEILAQAEDKTTEETQQEEEVLMDTSQEIWMDKEFESSEEIDEEKEDQNNSTLTDESSESKASEETKQDADTEESESSEIVVCNPFWFCGPPHNREAFGLKSEEEDTKEKASESRGSALEEVKHAIEKTAVDLRQIDDVVRTSTANEAFDYVREAVKDAVNEVKFIETVVQRLEEEIEDAEKATTEKRDEEEDGFENTSSLPITENHSDCDKTEKEDSELEKAVKEVKRDVDRVEAAVEKFAQTERIGEMEEEDLVDASGITLEAPDDEGSKEGKFGRNNHKFISENSLTAPILTEESKIEQCSIAHVFYGGEIINCQRCSALQGQSRNSLKPSVDEIESPRTNSPQEQIVGCTDSLIAGQEITDPNNNCRMDLTEDDFARRRSSSCEPATAGDSGRDGRGQLINCSRASSNPPFSKPSGPSSDPSNYSLSTRRSTPPSPPPSPTYKSRSGGWSCLVGYCTKRE